MISPTQSSIIHCDNTALIDIRHKGSMRDPETMTFMFMLYLRAAHHHINVVVTHINGIYNSIADSLSHFQMKWFSSLAPTSHQNPDHIPAWPIPCFIQSFQQLIYLTHMWPVEQKATVIAKFWFAINCIKAYCVKLRVQLKILRTFVLLRYRYIPHNSPVHKELEIFVLDPCSTWNVSYRCLFAMR